jgi:glycosyltransferase involved in cell wall biosynthesis
MLKKLALTHQNCPPNVRSILRRASLGCFSGTVGGVLDCAEQSSPNGRNAIIMPRSSKRLAIIVSHPIQYYAPLYQRLARRDDLLVKVFFTWHAGQGAAEDSGFGMPVAWDLPLTEGYDFEQVPNLSSDPGTHHFLGLRNPTLVERVSAWRPDVVQIMGWAWYSHLWAMYAFHRMGKPVVFRGDSHLLNSARRGARWQLKRAILRRVFSWPSGFLVVGAANRAYYEAFGVGPERLASCTHSIDVARFAQPTDRYEDEARLLRTRLDISDDKCVLLFAGKFERIKRPVELMRAVQAVPNPNLVLVMVGSGELSAEINAIAAANSARFRVLPFQNQTRMPVIYRLGDLCVLPSASETWGLAVNEALSCGRPVLVSDRVGCAADVVDASCGRAFSWTDPSSLPRALGEMTKDRDVLREMGKSAAKRAWLFDVARTEAQLMASLENLRIA